MINFWPSNATMLLKKQIFHILEFKYVFFKQLQVINKNLIFFEFPCAFAELEFCFAYHITHFNTPLSIFLIILM
jgi:hypothetical protein